MSPAMGWRVYRPSWGVAIFLCGQPIAWAARGSLGIPNSNSLFPAAATLLGLVLLVRLHWLRSARLYCEPVALAVPVLLICLPAALMSIYAPVQLGVLGLYDVCLAALALFVALNETEDFDQLPLAVMIIGMLSSATPLLQLAVFGVARGFFRLTIIGNDNAILTGDVGGITVVAAMVVGLVTGRNSFRLGLLSGVAGSIGLAGVLLSGTRSAMLALLVCVPLLLLLRSRTVGPVRGVSGRRRTIGFVTVLAGFAAGAPTAALAFFGTKVIGSISTRGMERITGAFIFFSDGSFNADASSSIRWSLVESTWRNLGWGGEGMMAQTLAQGQGTYPHLAYLQAFYDLGVLGGTLFWLAAFIVPLAIIASTVLRRKVSATELLVMLLFFFSQGDQWTHAPPYTWFSLLPVALVYVILLRRPQGRASFQTVAAELA